MQYFWKKKTIVTYLLSVLVFLIHISSFSNYASTGDAVSKLNNFISVFFKQAITSHAVTLFFIISGVLFFRNYDSTMYFDKLKSRIKTLVIPFLIWNFIWMLFSIITSYTFLSSYFIGREKIIVSLSSVLNAIFHYGCNIPFWFIFELFFFVLITPIIDIVIKNKYIGVFAVVLLIILAEFNIGLPTPLFFSKTALSYYILGGLIGKHYFEKFSTKSSKKVRFFSSVGAILCTIFLYSKYSLRLEMPTMIYEILKIAYSFFFWYGMDLFIDKMKMYDFYSNSFMVYAMHLNVSAIVCKLYFLFLPQNQYFAIPNFILTTITTLFIINLFSLVLKRHFCKLNSLLVGMR